MTEPLFKLGRGPIGEDEQEFAHGDVFLRESIGGRERVVLGAARGHVDLLLDLARGVEGPYWVLFVLVLSRQGSAEIGRYQSERMVGYEELEGFLDRFRDFLERDGRHHLWVATDGGAQQFIYDHHQRIYAYGAVDLAESVARARGMTPGEADLCVPHSHHYHASFDEDEAALLAYWPWRRTPLQPGDDD